MTYKPMRAGYVNDILFIICITVHVTIINKNLLLLPHRSAMSLQLGISLLHVICVYDPNFVLHSDRRSLVSLIIFVNYNSSQIN